MEVIRLNTGTHDRLRGALAIANVPTLLMLLVNMTGDLHWIEEPFLTTRPEGMDDNDSGGLSEELQAQVRAAALDAIAEWMDGKPFAIDDPSEDLLTQMLSAAVGEPLSAEFGPRIAATLRPVLQPRSRAPRRLNAPLDPNFRVLIVGAGFSGICAAVELARAEIPFVVFEKNDRVGGTWYESQYPGAAVDTPSHIYSFSFANHDWSRYFSDRDSVMAYLEDVASRTGTHKSIRFNHEVLEAAFDDDDQLWHVRYVDDTGSEASMATSVVVSAVGAFNPPRLPAIPGLDTFEGVSAHTAAWPVGLDVTGLRVGVVGNGASAMQVVPAIVDDVDSLTIFQRSQQWISPFPKYQLEIPEPVRWLMGAVPLYTAWYRERLGWVHGDRVLPTLRRDPDWPTPQRSLNAYNENLRIQLEAYLTSELEGRPDLVEKVLPDFPPYGKRMLLDNGGWYRTLTRPNVTLETDPLLEVRPGGVITEHGHDYDLDAIIYATGFDIARFVSTFSVKGRDGLDLREAWDDDDCRAYLGLAVPGFPNFFIMYGPNTAPGGGGSLLYSVEAQVHYLVDVLRKMNDLGAAVVECRQEVYEAYIEKVEDAHSKLVYTHPGVRTYYKNSKGRVVVNSPFRNVDFWSATREADLAEYVVEYPHEVAASTGQKSPLGYGEHG
jgi:4-hydroxyacetophenone monooxygenase